MPQVELWSNHYERRTHRWIHKLEEEEVAGIVSDALGFERGEDGKTKFVGVAGVFHYGLEYNMGDVNCFVWGGGEWAGWSKEKLDVATAEIHAGLAQMIDDPELTLVVELLPIPGNTFKIGPAALPTEPDFAPDV